MARIAYESKNFRPDSLEIIRQANSICREYRAQGFDLTLRQLYYQFVSRDLLANTVKNYNRLGSIVNDARMAGKLDWDYIVDRGRNSVSRNHYDSPGEIIDIASRAYNRDLWAAQRMRVEVWIEKDALSGVIEPTCDRYDVTSFACKGYTSQSEMWAAGQRIGAYIADGQRVVVLHLGDHDPSGLDMTRDICDRLDTFTVQDFLNAHSGDFPGDRVKTGDIRRAMAEHCGLDTEGWIPLAPKFGAGGALEVRRIALTMDQVEEFGPPPNPAKTTDSRFEGYSAEFGDESWELDALDPATLAGLIENEIDDLLDDDAWEEARDTETEHRQGLARAAARWAEVEAFVGDGTTGGDR